MINNHNQNTQPATHRIDPDSLRSDFLTRKGVRPTIDSGEYTQHRNRQDTERGKRIGFTVIAATVVALGAAAGVRHSAESVDEDKQHQTYEQVTASKNLQRVKAHDGDNLGSIVIEKSDIIAENGVSRNGAANEAIKYVAAMPENEAALSDGVLQAGEKVKVPEWIKVSVVEGAQADSPSDITIEQ